MFLDSYYAVVYVSILCILFLKAKTTTAIIAAIA